mgnify:CR=1 FL=1
MARCDRFPLPKGMAENDQVECYSRAFTRLRNVDSSLGQGSKKPKPQSSASRRAGAGEDRDRPARGRAGHQGHPVEPCAAEASALLQSHPADAHSSAEGGAKLVLIADSTRL